MASFHAENHLERQHYEKNIENSGVTWEEDFLP